MVAGTSAASPKFTASRLDSATRALPRFVGSETSAATSQREQMGTAPWPRRSNCHPAGQGQVSADGDLQAEVPGQLLRLLWLLLGNIRSEIRPRLRRTDPDSRNGTLH